MGKVVNITDAMVDQVSLSNWKNSAFGLLFIGGVLIASGVFFSYLGELMSMLNVLFQ